MHSGSAEYRIVEIALAQALPIRHEVLQFADSPAASIVPGDNEATTRHFGCFVDGDLVGVASLLLESLGDDYKGKAFRIRAMAVKPAAQRKGIGGCLLKRIIEVARSEDANYIWCTVRPGAQPFYTRMGFLADGIQVEMSHGNFQRMRFVLLSSRDSGRTELNLSGDTL